ncbi:MAG TPA: hypothetical protein VHB54_04770 [Mucilaginibacter sp.]|nr:hypothetical protein [Mucilaginibacter sp.]
MSEQNIIQNARKYVYNLRNAGSENGLKDSDAWQLSLVSRAERNTLKRNYQIAIVIELIPEVIRAFLTEVKAAMTRAGGTFTRIGNLDFKTREVQYLVAYSNKRGK